MKNNATLYIAYGSNMNINQMAQRCPTAKPVANSCLEGYRLRFKGGAHSSVATIELSKDDLVPIVIWEIQPSDEICTARKLFGLSSVKRDSRP